MNPYRTPWIRLDRRHHQNGADALRRARPTRSGLAVLDALEDDTEGVYEDAEILAIIMAAIEQMCYRHREIVGHPDPGDVFEGLVIGGPLRLTRMGFGPPDSDQIIPWSALALDRIAVLEEHGR